MDTPAVYQHNGFDDIITLDDDDDYMNSVDFDIPAPIVEFTEFDNTLVINNDESIPNTPVYGQTANVPVRNNSFNENVAAIEGQLAVKPPVRQYTPVRSDCRFNRPLINTTVNDAQLNRPLINDQFNRPVNSATGNVTRFTRPAEHTNNTHLKRLLHTSPAHGPRFYSTLNRASVNVNNINRPLSNPVANNAQPNRLLNNAVNVPRFTRPLNNATVLNAQFNRPLNNATVNNTRLNSPLNNATVNNARFIRPLINATVNDAQLNRPLNNAIVSDAQLNTLVNDARFNRPLNGLPLNQSVNGERINVQLNVGGKQNQYTLLVQEVPIEF